jgi:hypothetical protein
MSDFTYYIIRPNNYHFLLFVNIIGRIVKYLRQKF